MTVYEALSAKLGREPKREELKAEVARIIHEGNMQARAAQRREVRQMRRQH